ncbi:hypothetical protein CBL_00885 [Carabus blaptoides fortunei]
MLLWYFKHLQQLTAQSAHLVVLNYPSIDDAITRFDKVCEPSRRDSSGSVSERLRGPTHSYYNFPASVNSHKFWESARSGPTRNWGILIYHTRTDISRETAAS